MIETERLDVALARRLLARSRSHATTLIADGVVRVDGKTALRASQRVALDAQLDVIGDHGYVSRGALKLVAALDAFDVPVSERRALDAGASTGGFSQVLLERGAARVIAIDVGHDQLAPQLLDDPRLIQAEGVNIRSCTPSDLESFTGETAPPDLVVADLSFISLTQVIPALRALATPEADVILLIKPQFEVGRGGIREGIVRDAHLREDAVERVLWAAFDAGLGVAGLIESPIAGSHGNREYLVHLSPTGTHPTNWLDRVTEITR